VNNLRIATVDDLGSDAATVPRATPIDLTSTAPRKPQMHEAAAIDEPTITFLPCNH
jgi:hypothetical protein